jgi:putative spermidine/putrescine transport system permease protein
MTKRPAASLAERVGRATNRLLLLLACVVIFLPLVLTLYLSLFNEQMIVFPPHGYTFAWYGQIAGKFGGAIWTSLQIALAAVAFSLVIGIPAGIGLSRYRFRGRDALGTFLLSPLTIPGIAIGLALYVLAVWIEEQTGLELAGSIRLLIMAHVLITMPWVVRLCLASLTNHERTTEEAASSLGASPLMVLLRVTLPAMRPGIVAAALFAFIVSFENLEINLFLVAPGMTTLPVAVLQYLQYHIDPLVAAVAVAQIAIVGAALVVLDRFVQLGRVV